MRHVWRLILGVVILLFVMGIAGGAAIILQHPKWIILGFASAMVALVCYCLGAAFIK